MHPHRLSPTLIHSQNSTGDLVLTFLSRHCTYVVQAFNIRMSSSFTQLTLVLNNGFILEVSMHLLANTPPRSSPCHRHIRAMHATTGFSIFSVHIHLAGKFNDSTHVSPKSTKHGLCDVVLCA